MSSQNLEGSNSCVETPAAPEWLSQLENRREKLKRAKLGHEAGAGAPCVECGDGCPGLDLHFWRKVCRNCKCRKDQHMCKDDDLSGWAQFEILGQIRSKPAFIKIKALANEEPVRLEWVPPNAAADIVSDYMEKLGTKQIPIAGSDAAVKRKQQLEFQVPPHDLDATLCDNLTESEIQQLQQYVQKIRDNCVGQGNVVRVGNQGQAFIAHLPQIKYLSNMDAFNPEQVKVLKALGEEPIADPILNDLLSSDKLKKALLNDVKESYPKMLIGYNDPITDSLAEFEQEPTLSSPSKEKLCGLNKKAVHSLVHNGPIYDKILTVLKAKNLDISRDPKLGPIADFRREYLTNPQFNHEVNAITPLKESIKPQFATPLKAPQNDLSFHSPITLKNPIKTRFGAQMRQDTPMRKVTFGNVSTAIYDCGLPPHVDYTKDAVFSGIVNSEPLKQAFKETSPHHSKHKKPLILALTPLKPDYFDDPLLSPSAKQKLKAINVDSKTLQSALLNGPFYDQLFRALEEKGINYEDCKLLKPLAKLREQFANDKPFYDEVKAFVAQMPSSFDIAFGSPQQIFKAAAISNSHSNDSGFDSKASTPSHGSTDELNAAAGRFTSIPGIEEMNMYPNVAPSNFIEHLPQAMHQLHLGNADVSPLSPSVVLPCRDCNEPISFGEVAVKAERAGKEIAWHPACFKCHTCRELLADLVYFFHGGQVYCGRDLAIKLKIPRCKACDELIFTKEYTAAEGSTFHIKHFCCFQCDVPLAGQQYIPDEKSNMPLCLKCYDEFYAASCQFCKRPIGPADQGVAWKDIHWHGDCFICAGQNCAKSLIGGRFCVKQNMPFCSPACVRSIIN